MFIKIVRRPTKIKYETTSQYPDRIEIWEWYDFETTITLKLFNWRKTFVINKYSEVELKGMRYEGTN